MRWKEWKVSLTQSIGNDRATNCSSSQTSSSTHHHLLLIVLFLVLRAAVATMSVLIMASICSTRNTMTIVEAASVMIAVLRKQRLGRKIPGHLIVGELKISPSLSSRVPESGPARRYGGGRRQRRTVLAERRCTIVRVLRRRSTILTGRWGTIVRILRRSILAGRSTILLMAARLFET